MSVKHRLFWVAFDCLLFGLCFIAIGFIFYCQQDKIYYMDGKHGTNFGFIMNIFCFWVWMITLCVFSPLMILRLYFWKNVIESIKRLLFFRTVTIALVGLFVLFATTATFSGKPRAELFTKGYRDWAEETLDIEEIRNWSSIFELEDHSSFEFFIDENFKGPKCLLEHRLRFTVGYIRKKENSPVTLDLHSGGGFQDWGVFIGPKDMEVPYFETEMLDSNYGEYRLRLADGAYAWYELQ